MTQFSLKISIQITPPLESQVLQIRYTNSTHMRAHPYADHTHYCYRCSIFDNAFQIFDFDGHNSATSGVRHSTLDTYNLDS